MRTAMMLLALALIGAPACKKKTTTAPATGSGSAMGSAGSAGSGSAMEGSAGSGSAMEGSAGSGSAMEGSAGSAGSAMEGSAGSAAEGSGAEGGATMTHKAEKCPSTVAGATTTASVKGKDVIVTVTAKDKAAIAMIQKRADESVKPKTEAKEPSAEHTQQGVHGGTAGICPVYVPTGATAKVKHEKAGVVVTITPKEKPDDLKKDIDDRITKAEAWAKENPSGGDEGGGGGKGTGGGHGKGTGGGK